MDFQKNKKIVLAIVITCVGILALSALFVPSKITLTRIPETESDKQKNEALGIAQKYVVTTPTFAFDGIINTLDTEHVEMMQSYSPQYLIIMAFDSSHDGYGDRQGQDTEKGITHHRMEIVVSQGKVISAVTDKIWDEINNKSIQKTQSKLHSSNEIIEFNGEVKDLTSLTYALKSRGLDVKSTERIPDSFFSVPTTVLSISGIDVQIYEFTSEYDIAKARAIVSQDGTQIGPNSVRWMDVPHFYSKEKMIVQYIGHNPEITSMLESFLGNQFAGNTL